MGRALAAAHDKCVHAAQLTRAEDPGTTSRQLTSVRSCLTRRSRPCSSALRLSTRHAAAYTARSGRLANGRQARSGASARDELKVIAEGFSISAERHCAAPAVLGLRTT